MKKKYYEVKTFMTFEKTVYVPADEVADESEAKELVANAVEVCEINLLGLDADQGEICDGKVELDESELQHVQIIHNVN